MPRFGRVVLFLWMAACTGGKPFTLDKRQQREAQDSKAALPAQGGDDAADVKGRWLALTGPDHQCSLLYEFQDNLRLRTQLDCFRPESRVIERETRLYRSEFQSESGRLRLFLLESSCQGRQLEQELSWQWLPQAEGQSRLLRLAHPTLSDITLSLREVSKFYDESFLSTQLYRGVPIRMGCFQQGKASAFEALSGEQSQ